MGSLAQLVEHRTFNPMVERSNRSRPTIHHKGFNKLSPFFISVKSTLVQVWYTIEDYGMMPPEKTLDLMIEAHNPNDR